MAGRGAKIESKREFDRMTEAAMNLAELNKVAEAMVAPGPRPSGRGRILGHHQEAF
jgi:hypothetical protein